MNKNEISEIINSLNEEQQEAVRIMVEDALQHGETSKKEIIKTEATNALKHGVKLGSIRDSVLEHAAKYGIEGIDMLFPDHKLAQGPSFITNPVEWVNHVLPKVHKLPFSRVKSLFVDITDESLRAKGYVKGNRKKEAALALLKRETNPTTIYKKQKIDRDDMVDITDYEAVSWIKKEMKMKMDEETARCILFGDGRAIDNVDKVDDQCIRPIISDDDLFTIRKLISKTDGVSEYIELRKTVLRNLKLYKGTGKPTMFVPEDTITELLLLETPIGTPVYKDVEDIARKFRVGNVVGIQEMDSVVRTDADGVNHRVLALIVNLNDYGVGTDRGGQVTMFDDFDIDYNQYKYLIEGRCSGALITPYSALVIEDVIVQTPAVLSEDIEPETNEIDE